MLGCTDLSRGGATGWAGRAWAGGGGGARALPEMGAHGHGLTAALGGFFCEEPQSSHLGSGECGPWPSCLSLTLL